MSPLVVDASAALKLLRVEPASDEVRRHIREAELQADPIIVPPMFWYEVVNVLGVRYRRPGGAIVEAVYELEQIGLQTTDLGRPGTLAIVDAVGRTGLTAYDAAYLVLAESSDAALLTADARLAQSAGPRAILVGSLHRTSEVEETYAPPSAWPEWPGAVGYLMELRRAALDVKGRR